MTLTAAGIFLGASFFGVAMSFLWYRGGLSLFFFWYRDLLFGIEILHSVVQHLDRPLPGISPSVLLWALTSCKMEVKKFRYRKEDRKKTRYLKKDISIPTSRSSQTGTLQTGTLRIPRTLPLRKRKGGKRLDPSDKNR